jgi:hypothetical protein
MDLGLMGGKVKRHLSMTGGRTPLHGKKGLVVGIAFDRQHRIH